MNDDFEKRLQQTAPRKISSAWREEILSAARTSAAGQEPRITSDGLLPRLIREFLALGRLPRLAWGGLAAAWLVILGLHFSGGPESTTPAATSAMAADQTRQALKQKQLLLVELAGAVETQPVIRPPGPRSQRRESIAVT